jgi:hypothetical protein
MAPKQVHVWGVTFMKVIVMLFVYRLRALWRSEGDRQSEVQFSEERHLMLHLQSPGSLKAAVKNRQPLFKHNTQSDERRHKRTTRILFAF